MNTKWLTKTTVVKKVHFQCWISTIVVEVVSNHKLLLDKTSCSCNGIGAFVVVNLLIFTANVCIQNSHKTSCKCNVPFSAGTKQRYWSAFAILQLIWASFWENRSSGFPTRSATNKAVQSQKMARGSKFWI